MDGSFALLEKVETALISESLRHRLVVGNAQNKVLRLSRYLHFILGQSADLSWRFDAACRIFCLAQALNNWGSAVGLLRSATPMRNSTSPRSFT
jgi:hypothetical protein